MPHARRVASLANCAVCGMSVQPAIKHYLQTMQCNANTLQFALFAGGRFSKRNFVFGAIAAPGRQAYLDPFARRHHAESGVFVIGRTFGIDKLQGT